MGKLYTKLCAFCGELFCTTRRNVVYHSDRCANKARITAFTRNRKSQIQNRSSRIECGKSLLSGDGGHNGNRKSLNSKELGYAEYLCKSSDKACGPKSGVVGNYRELGGAE